MESVLQILSQNEPQEIVEPELNRHLELAPPDNSSIMGHIGETAYGFGEYTCSL
jgi:hypothetical protein